MWLAEAVVVAVAGVPSCLSRPGPRNYMARPTAAVMAAVVLLGATRATGVDRFRVIVVIEKGRVVVSSRIAHRHHL